MLQQQMRSKIDLSLQQIRSKHLTDVKFQIIELRESNNQEKLDNKKQFLQKKKKRNDFPFIINFCAKPYLESQ